MAQEKLKNPIIPGYYPDPSIIRVGDDFYLACSSFEMYPGIPIFHSRDLAHWEQISNAMTLENGFRIDKNSGVGGVMAPTIRYNDGIYYIINANFADRGNFIVTATDPAGPWSKPHYLDDVPGIDASLFFDTDGKAYVMGTGDVWDNGAGKMERGIWLASYDIENFKLLGEPVCIFNSAMRGAASPEAPHLYHIGDYYYLMIAEGGTEHYHSVAVARSKEIFGFYENNPANPVMTHRHMGFTCPIINVGHADFVELQDGSWYAVMLASRLIDGKAKNLGRETFICPVVWERGWPLFSPETGRVEWEYPAPACLAAGAESVAHPSTSRVGGSTSSPTRAVASAEPVEASGESGASTWCGVSVRDDFDTPALALDWVTWGAPYVQFHEIADSRLKLRCLPEKLDEELRPMPDTSPRSDEEHVMAFLAKRQTQPVQTFSCAMEFSPNENEAAGLAVVQALNHQIHFERTCVGGKQLLRVVLVTADYNVPPFIPSFTSTTNRAVLWEAPCDAHQLVLRIAMRNEDFAFSYGAVGGSSASNTTSGASGSPDGTPGTTDNAPLQTACHVDGFLINPEKVGCMTGTLVGMYATAKGAKSENAALFDWFERRE